MFDWVTWRDLQPTWELAHLRSIVEGVGLDHALHLSSLSLYCLDDVTFLQILDLLHESVLAKGYQ